MERRYEEKARALPPGVFDNQEFEAGKRLSAEAAIAAGLDPDPLGAR